MYLRCKKHFVFISTFLFLLLTVSQKIQAQECVERKPISVAIAIDVSGSMYGNLPTARDFAIGLVNGLNATGNLVEVEIFLFNNYVPACASPCGEYIWGSPSGSTTWVSALNDSHAGGGTALFSAAYAGATITSARSSSNFKLFVLLTDGDDDGSSVHTFSQAATALGASGLVSRLIFVGNSSSGAATLNSLAATAGPNTVAINSTFAGLNGLISEIVDATCVNHRPVASISISDNNLALCTDGTSIDFNGSSSHDQETSSSSLNYTWTFTRPDGSTFTRNSRTFTESFNDSQLNHGTNWNVSLVVKDAKNVSSNSVNQGFSVTGSPPNISLSSSPASPIDANVTAMVEANPANDCDGGGAMNFNWTVLDHPAGGVLPSPLNTRVIPLSAQEENITTYSDGTDFRNLWHFQCVATDNESDNDTKDITIRIKNLPPDIDFIGDSEIDVNYPIQVGTTILNDDDGGALSFSWDIIQAPNSASTGIQNGYSHTSDFVLPTDNSYAGTWILKLTATDNEGEEYSDTFSVLVDGLPVADITGPVASIGSITGFPLTLDASGSIDPDSRDDLPNHGHSTSEPPVKEISPGIVSYTWSLIDAPLDNPNLFALGRVDEVLGIDCSGPSITIPFSKRLTPGYYTFMVEVRDGEDNVDQAEYQIDVIEEESKPFALIYPPVTVQYLDPVTNLLTSNITLSGNFSFDPDNFLSSSPSLGITNYSWNYKSAPLTCPAYPTPPNGAALDHFTLSTAGDIIPFNCQGLWEITLEVTDDDPIPKTNSPLAEALVILGNCPSNLCIDYPTHLNPQTVQLTDNTDITIYFHLNAVMYANPAALFGTIARLEILYESDPIPFYTVDDPNLLATDMGGYLRFHWNGYGNLLQRPKPGKYHVRVTLLDQAMAMTIGGDDQLEAILIAVAEPEISTSSDKLIDREKLVVGTDQVDFNYTIKGGGSPDEMKWYIYDAGNAVVKQGSLASPPNAGNFSWDGKNSVPEVVPSGTYYLELETFYQGNSMDKSPKFEFTIFTCDIDADTNRDGIVDDSGDDTNENTWTVASGSIFEVNYDRDGSRSDAGLPIGDALFIDDLGIPGLEDKNIENVADMQDITPFVIRKFMNVFPPTVKVFLKAGELEDIQSIHVFKKIAAGETAIWGSLGSRIGGVTEPLELDITTYVDPASPNFQGDPVTGDCTFGLEGLFFRNTGVVNPFDGEIDLTLTIKDGATVLSSDQIRMKVAPFLMISHNQPSSEVWVLDGGVDNVEMRQTASTAPGYYALEFSTQMHEVAWNPTIAGSQWFQDHLEIGYYKRPGGNTNHCVFRLPYGTQPTWPMHHLLAGQFGEFQIGEQILPTSISGDFGGNVEILPPNTVNKNGRVVLGTRRSTELFTFFQSQEVQAPFSVNTNWLAVGHVDEIFEFTGNPNEMIVADPADAYALMNAIPVADRGRSVFFATGANNPVSGTVPSISAVGNRINTGIDHTVGPAWEYIRIYNDAGSSARGQVAHISNRQNGYLEVDRVWFTGASILPVSPLLDTYGKYILGSEAPNQLTWFVNPDVGDKFVLVEGTRFWHHGTPSVITVEEILADPELHDLNLTDVQNEINTIKSAIHAANGLPVTEIKVPTIYFGDRTGFASNESCVALTPGLANYQPVNGKLYFPRQFGPRNTMGQDIFEITTLSRIPQAVFTDDWVLYHAREGEVHCGTNVKRVIPGFNWWNP